MTLIEVVVAFGISAFVVALSSSLIFESKKIESSQQRQFWLSARRMYMQEMIKSSTGWNLILSLNPSMSCFQNNSSCSSYTNPQSLKLPFATQVLDGTNSKTGLTNTGDLCEEFDAINGNATCPIGIKPRWQAICDNSNCLHAQPKVTVEFYERDKISTANIHLKSQDLILFKDPKLEALNNVCTGMGGVLSGTSCDIPALTTSCDPNNSKGSGASFPIGFDSTGVVTCGKPNPGQCASSDIAVGFDSNGGILCEPACL